MDIDKKIDEKFKYFEDIDCKIKEKSTPKDINRSKSIKVIQSKSTSCGRDRGKILGLFL